MKSADRSLALMLAMMTLLLVAGLRPSLAANESCGSLAAGSLQTKALGTEPLSIAGTDSSNPAERQPTKVFIRFCRAGLGSRLLNLTRGSSVLDRVVITKFVGGPTFDMRGVKARPTGNDNILVLTFKTIAVTEPAPRPADPLGVP